MTALGSLVRLSLISASVLSAAAGTVLVTAPSPITHALKLPPTEPTHVVTAFGVAVLLAIVAFLLRPARGVHYEAVRFHDPVDIRRPVPANFRPKVGEKVRKKVRDDDARRVMQRRPR